MIVRREAPADVETVHVVHDAAFGAPSAEAALVELLRADPDNWRPEFSLVAELSRSSVDGVNASVAGHILGSRALLDEKLPVIAVGPVAVAPEFQRRGIGTVLVHALCAAADALGEPLVVLLGDPAFYSRCGFVLAGTRGVIPPVAAWAPHFQVRPLTMYTPAHRGKFRYAPAFATVS